MMGLTKPKSVEEAYVGEGIVTQVIYPQKLWQVEFRGSFWTAESRYPVMFLPGDFVQVIGLRGINLQIEPVTLT
jgi:membrane protein implicated in regulation of membrane protease activity